MTNELNRRSFLKRTGQTGSLVLAGSLLPTVLAACGGNISNAPAAGAKIESKGLKTAGVLQWGATAENGAPYVYQNPDGSGLIGFEQEIADAIAKLMGISQKHVETDYAQMEQALQAGNFDVVINGWEATEDRQKTEIFTQSYYHYGQQIVVRTNDPRFANKTQDDTLSLTDLHGYKVGTGAGFKAETLLADDKAITLQSYDPDLPFNDLALGRIDAVLIDLPTVAYFVQGAGPGGQKNKDLKLIGKPFALGDYVIGLNKSNPNAETLRKELDQALTELKSNGTLRQIYQKWNLWNDQQAAIGIK
ncbi:ABC transporter substrate-binding protein [Tengunoibacter tsumagoiensis]|nr:ABC transporter substrate-binding protein [Tengunoibacter tsumagoiensis]